MDESEFESLKSAELLEGDALRERVGRLDEVQVDDEGQVVGRCESVVCADTKTWTKVHDGRDVQEVERLAKHRGIDWQPEMAERTVPYVASTERVDRDGDIVRQDWIFESFKGNSPLLSGHAWGSPPIGRNIDWGVERVSLRGYEGPALALLSLFDAGDDADRIFRLVKSGFMPAGSVGFRSHRVIDVKDDDERAKLGLGRWGVIFERNELLEFSAVTIPSNPDAMARRLRSFGEAPKDLEPEDIDVVRDLARRTVARGSREIEQFYGYEAVLLDVARRLWPAERFELHRDLDMPVTLARQERQRGHSASDEILRVVRELRDRIDDFDTRSGDDHSPDEPLFDGEVGETADRIMRALEQREGSTATT